MGAVVAAAVLNLSLTRNKSLIRAQARHCAVLRKEFPTTKKVGEVEVKITLTGAAKIKLIQVLADPFHLKRGLQLQLQKKINRRNPIVVIRSMVVMVDGRIEPHHGHGE